MAVRLNRAGHRPFVGRARELAAAAEILADAEQTGVALLGGESGLGKTGWPRRSSQPPRPTLG